jgi:hypothetical protein
MTTSKYEFHQFQDVDNMVMAKGGKIIYVIALRPA